MKRRLLRVAARLRRDYGAQQNVPAVALPAQPPKYSLGGTASARRLAPVSNRRVT
jgi:hypothetical protein